MNKDLNLLKEKIEKFKIDQQKQKARGLNNYNIMNILRKPYEEVGLHSNFIYSLLDINGEHFQDDLFVNIFIKEVLKIDDFGKVIEVNQEELTTKNRRIDFTIKSKKYYIGVEMKIYAQDQKYQIYDYHKDLESKSKNKEIVQIYYLTLNGKEASENSYKNNDEEISYKKISFQKDILNWLKKSQYEVQNITNLNNAIGYYIEMIEKLIGTYKNKIMKLEDLLLSNKTLFQIAQEFYTKNNITNNLEKDIYQAYERAREKLTKQFFEKILIDKIKNEFNYQVEFSNQDCAYKITIKDSEKEFVLGSKNYSTTDDYYKCNSNNQKLTKYRYRYDSQTINDFFDKSALNYYINLIKECFDYK